MESLGTEARGEREKGGEKGKRSERRKGGEKGKRSERRKRSERGKGEKRSEGGKRGDIGGEGKRGILETGGEKEHLY